MAIEITFLSVVLRQSALDHLPPDIRDLARGLFRWEPDWFREDLRQACREASWTVMRGWDPSPFD